jgi:hypothetical protein
VDWRVYLLPAGETSFLPGVKSMIVDPFIPDEKLSDRLLRRDTPLLDEGILVLKGRVGRKDNMVRCDQDLVNHSEYIISFWLL